MNNSQRRQGANLVGAILLALATFFVSACGSSSNDDLNQISGQQGNAGQGNLSYVGRFLGANNLFNGQTSVLDLTTSTSGSATGTLTVSTVPVRGQGVTTPGTYPVSGSVNLANGFFQVSGTITGVGPFAIEGTLPVGTAQGSYTLSINGQTFAGVIQNSNLGTPTPPNNNNPTGDLITSGTLSSFIFAPDGSYNGVNPPVSNSDRFGGAVGTGQNDINSATIAVTNSTVSGTTVNLRAFVVSVNLPDGEELTVGETYPLAGTNGRGAVISLSESTGTTVNRAWAPTASTTGSVTITSLTDTAIEMDFDFSNVGPNSEVANNTATGSFDTSGHLVGNFAARL